MPNFPADVRRKQLIEAAIVVATSEGIDAASTRRVAKQAGVSVGVVHYCFGTKENLFHEVIKTIVDQITESSTPAPLPGEDLRSFLSRAAEAYCLAIELDPDAHRLTYELTTYTVRTPTEQALGRWQYDCYFGAAREFLERAAQMTNVTWTVPVETLARMLIALIEGATLAWLVDRRGDQLRQVYAAFIDHLLALAAPNGLTDPAVNIETVEQR
jgi:AcrR family transcriptional regulator